MPSRSNDGDKDTQVGVKSYGAPMGPAAPSYSGAERNTAREGSDTARRAAIAANDTAARKPVKTPPPAAAPVDDNPGAGVGGRRRAKAIDDYVGKIQK